MSTEPNKPEPLPINIRMLVAFALAGLVIFGTPYFYKAIGIKLPEKQEEQQKASPSKTQQQPPSSPAAAAPAPQQQQQPPSKQGEEQQPPAAGNVAAAKEESFSLDTDYYHIVFSNQGAVVKSWTLKKYLDHEGKPLDVVNPTAASKAGFPFRYEFRNIKPPVDLNQALFKATEAPDNLSVDFEYSNGGVSAHKTFTFKRDSYLLRVESSVSMNGQPTTHLLGWRGGFGDMAVSNESSKTSEVYYDVSADKPSREAAKSAKNGPINKDGTFAWVGLEDQYFAAVFLPSETGTIQTTIFDDEVKTRYNTADEPFVGVAVGGDGDNRLSLYLGPKEVDTLRKLSPKLEYLVDFGRLAIIARPLFQSLRWMNENWFHNYGWSIIVATIIINMVLFPLKLANLKSMRKMQALQPEIQKINEKYKAIPLRDPRQADKNAEMMALYQKAGTNPMSGCIPMLIQMPFLWAFYTVLTVSIALRGASWLWVGDLSQPEQIGIRVLPVLLVVTGFLMQKMTPMASVDPNQQRMMMFMPLMMGFIFYQASSGLVLYWLTGNLVGIAQQWVLNKFVPKPEAPPAKEVKKSSNRK